MDDDNEPRLNCDAIESTSVPIDWQERLGENGDGWRSYECSTCDGCKHDVVVSTMGGCECREAMPTVEIVDEDGNESEEDNDCDTTLYNEGPMMSFYIPVRIDDCEEAARKIRELPLCVVEFDDGSTALALTGGGMDLRWEICDAFISLGYYPPVYFCDLPRMTAKLSDERKHIVAMCKKSIEIKAHWLANQTSKLDELLVASDVAEEEERREQAAVANKVSSAGMGSRRKCRNSVRWG